MDFLNRNRLRLGIIFNFNPSWMGGIVYIINLLKTLEYLDDSNKPEIILFYRSDLKKFVDEMDYPNLLKVEWDFPSTYKGYLFSWVSRKNIFVQRILEYYDLDGIYPIHDFPVRSRTKTQLISWYADLQHEYFPEFFTRRKIVERNARIRFMLRNSDGLVVSSQSVRNDFEKFFRLPKNLKLKVFHFVSGTEDLSGLNISELKEKYHLPEKYFMISNQFHKHKNHIVLLRSLVRLKQSGVKVHLAMTGRFPDVSYSDYMKELRLLIDEHELHSQISILGIIPRKEQLLLMKHALAVIQPSLFEGWSTVVEDAKALQVPVIASSLAVNIEQLGSDGEFFEPFDDQKLAEILLRSPERNIDDLFYEDHYSRALKAAKSFLEIFSNNN
jgi:glycosyltransferase involved in cell wall biosynthesis